jgi:hypothetical protein
MTFFPSNVLLIILPLDSPVSYLHTFPFLWKIFLDIHIPLERWAFTCEFLILDLLVFLDS